jgi:hypothetical protein
LGDLFRDLSGRVLIVCADLLQIADILHKCQIYRCAGFGFLIFFHAPVIECRGALLRVSFLLICPGMVAEFQSAQIKGYNKRIFAPVNA